MFSKSSLSYSLLILNFLILLYEQKNISKKTAIKHLKEVKIIKSRNKTVTNSTNFNPNPDMKTSDNHERNITIIKSAQSERSKQIISAKGFLEKIGVNEEALKKLDGEQSPLVLDGIESYSGQWPWQVLVTTSGGFCGGVLINNPCYVLTARHCTQGYTKDEITVTLGELDRSSSEGYEQQRTVLHIFEHPSFDASLLFLNHLVLSGSLFKVNSIQIASSIPDDGTMVTVSGWGWTDHSIRSPSNRLRHTQLPLVNWDTCAAVMNPVLNSPLNNNDICAGSSSSGNACHGDSGGPLVYHDGSSWKLIGIVNRGAAGCPSHINYAVYLSVPAIQGWINSIFRPSEFLITLAGRPCNCLYPVKKYSGTQVSKIYPEFDGVNCRIGAAHPGCNEPDQGNRVYVSQNKFYIRSHKANHCAKGHWDTCNCKIRDLKYDAPEFADFILQNGFYTSDFPEGNCQRGFEYDGNNCRYLVTPPSGTIASKWNNAWYTTAQPQCDSEMGTQFDGANCYWRPIPWFSGFIYENAYYLYAFGSGFCFEGIWDGSGCYIRHAPFGTTAFESNGNWYHTPQRTCDDGLFDGTNCQYMEPPLGSTAFVWQGSTYYGWL